MDDRITIVIADDHPLVREGLKKVISEQRDMAIIAECTTGFEALNQLAQQACDVLVLDINLPDRSGIDILRDVKNQYPRVRVLILSMYAEGAYALHAIQGGADGYLEKRAAGSDLPQAIRRIARGGRFISESLANLLADHASGIRQGARHSLLSTREFQVLLMIGEGKSVQDISERLAVALSTVNTYRSRILQKLGLESTRELIKYAVDHHLVD